MTQPGGSLARYLGSDESVVLSTRQHPFALVDQVLRTVWLLAPLLLVAWGIGGVEALRGAPATLVLRVVLLAVAGLVVRLVWHVLAWEFERVVITDEKVIHLEGVLHKRIASTPLAKVSEFTVHQPLVGRLFDYGQLVVDVPGGRDQALHGLDFLPDPAGLYRLVSDTARTERVHEGGGRMDEPTDGDLERIDMTVPVDLLDGASADHTIRLPRVEHRS